MKNSCRILIWLCLACTACEPVDTRVYLGRTRSDAFEKETAEDSRHKSDPVSPPEMKKDTSIYFCAVEVPESYDWRKDTACGSADAEILLFKNYEITARIKAGAPMHISSDPDSHHLVGGDLYTEFTDLTRTYVKKNGEDLFCYEGRERIHGMCIRNGSVWTLGQSLSGGGFSLRENGETVFKSEDGEVFGDLLLQPQGALYEDKDSLCFFYKVTENGRTRLFSVIDGKSSEVENKHTLVQDILISDGAVHVLASGINGKDPYIYRGENRTAISAGESLFEGYLLNAFQTVAAAGFLGSSLDKTETFLFHHNTLSRGPSCDICYIYPASGPCGRVYSDDGKINIRKVDGKEFSPDERYYFFSRACAAFIGNRYWAALTPIAEGGTPAIFTDGTTHPVKVNGFISCLEILVL